MELSFQSTSFPGKQLNELSHSHSRRKPVRVHDHIRTDAQFIVRQVLLRHDETNNTFLTMSTAELVTHFRYTRLP